MKCLAPDVLMLWQLDSAHVCEQKINPTKMDSLEVQGEIWPPVWLSAPREFYTVSILVELQGSF